MALRAGDWQVRLASAGAFMVGYTLVAQPTIEFYLLQFLPSFTIADHLLTALATFLVSAAVYPLPLAIGSWLSRSAKGEEPAAGGTTGRRHCNCAWLSFKLEGVDRIARSIIRQPLYVYTTFRSTGQTQ